MTLERFHRIPLHDHSDRNSGGKIHGPAIIEGIGGSGSLGGSGSSGDLLVSGTPDAISPTSEIRPVHGLATTDLGGGVAQIDVDETLLDGSLIPGAGRQLYPDLRDYGAICDNSTDDAAAVQDAIDDQDEYGAIWVPSMTALGGTLSVSKAITFLGPDTYPNPDTTPDGFAGLRQLSNNTTLIQQTAAKRLGLANLVLVNSGTAASGKGVLALGAVEARRILIRDFYDNMFIDGQSGGSYVTFLEKCFFHNAGRANVYLDDKINNFHMQGGAISTGPYGLLASGGIFAMSLEDVAIESYTTAGLYINGTGPGSGQQTNSVRLSNLTMDVVAGTAPDIWIGDTSAVQSVTIEDIWIEPGNAGMTHIRVDAADRLTIIGGHVKTPGGGSTSIDAAGATNVVLIDAKMDGTVTLPTSARILDGTDVTPVALSGSASVGTSKYFARGDHVHPTTGLGSGTVTSVAASVPAEFSISGSPITTTGTLAITKANETANTVWAGPTSGSAAQPTFRALVAADLPSGVGTTDHEHIDNLAFNGNGATTVFELPAAPFDAYSYAAYVAGVRVGATLSGTMLTVLTFDTAPASGTGNITVDLTAAVA
jgi:hypothetical protein